ncbi:MAG: hypothetical protein H6713_01830 [Myxococcales bacterium]|nr:hypothetical protein [Myxococcales bacterium]
MRRPERLARWDDARALTRVLGPGARFVAEYDTEGVVYVRAAATQRLVGRFQSRDTILALAVGADGSRVAIAHAREHLGVYESSTGALVHRLYVPCGRREFRRGDEPPPLSIVNEDIALAPDSRALLVHSRRDYPRHPPPPPMPLGTYLCELEGERPPQLLPGAQSTVGFSPDGRSIPLIVGDRVALWDREQGALQPPIPARRDRMYLRMSEEGERVWDPAHERYRDEMWRWTELFQRRLGNTTPPRSVAMSHDSSVIAWLRGDLLEFGPTRGPDTAEVHHAFFQGAGVVALDSAGELVAVTGHAYERPIRLIHLPTRAVETVHLYNEYIEAMAFDERGALFVLTLNNGIEVFGPAL